MDSRKGVLEDILYTPLIRFDAFDMVPAPFSTSSVSQGKIIPYCLFLFMEVVEPFQRGFIDWIGFHLGVASYLPGCCRFLR
jgi:hypothetical protein